MYTPAQLFKLALADKLDSQRKHAFVPAGASEQAAGPGGAPVDPMAAAGGAGAPPPGGAPMDPAAAGGMPPAGDPMAGGAPPPGADPMAGAMPPPPAGGEADPMAGMMPPPPPEGDAGAPPVDDTTNSAATDVDGDGKPDTMVPLVAMKDFAVSLIEAMKGKKTQDAAAPEAAGGAGGEKADPTAAPGPVTGMPGFDPATFGAPGSKVASVTKTAGILARTLKI